MNETHGVFPCMQKGVSVARVLRLLVTNASKKNIVDVPDNLALQYVRDIPTRYYQYIDEVAKGTNNTIGFIAQEVREVFPMAVTLHTRIIPSEYRVLENISWEEIIDANNNITYKMSSNLTDVSGVKYRFILPEAQTRDSDQDLQIDIIGNSDGTFTFDTQYSGVFCYGKQVDDLHMIDKDKIFALHHSAIQEIDKHQLAEKDKTAALEAKVIELETNVTELKAKNANLQSQLDNIITILNNNNLS